MDRRDFLATVPLCLASKALSGLDRSKLGFVVERSETTTTTTARSTSTSNKLDFASGLQAAEAIRRKEVSSVELIRRTFERIDRYNPQLNAFAYQIREDALAQAKKADEALSRGFSLGDFHGVPIHVKESFAVAGQPCTWGLVEFRDSKAARNSVVVDRLLGAGAVLIGATNVPVGLGDWQTYNPIYGTTNNPWDLKRTPGGSSGGTAAALAAGLGYLSVGSDIGGSIRVPAHFCGIYGHKPTLDLVSEQGQVPGGVNEAPGFSTLLAVAGPMARSAADLLAALKVLGGPAGWDAKAWKWEVPPPRGQSLSEFRVGYVLDDPIAPPTLEVKAVLEKTIQVLDRAGAKLKLGWPPGFQAADLLSNYGFLLDAFLFSVASPKEQETRRKNFAKSQSPDAAAALSSFADWQRQNLRRLRFRAQWQAYFEQVDVFLSPVAFSPAFPHDHSEPMDGRTIATSSGPRRYHDLLNWIAPATLTGCPATVAPVGRTQTGLPVGIQIMGPYWEDGTPITFADLLSREVGGFAAPPDYDE
jgi:amidase